MSILDRRDSEGGDLLNSSFEEDDDEVIALRLKANDEITYQVRDVIHEESREEESMMRGALLAESQAYDRDIFVNTNTTFQDEGGDSPSKLKYIEEELVLQNSHYGEMTHPKTFH